MAQYILSMIMNFVITVVNIVLSLLPSCPFDKYITLALENQTLSYINWFIPVPEIIVVCEAWLIVVGLYYGYQVIMRWVKMIK